MLEMHFLKCYYNFQKVENTVNDILETAKKKAGRMRNGVWESGNVVSGWASSMIATCSPGGIQLSVWA